MDQVFSHFLRRLAAGMHLQSPPYIATDQSRCSACM